MKFCPGVVTAATALDVVEGSAVIMETASKTVVSLALGLRAQSVSLTHVGGSSEWHTPLA